MIIINILHCFFTGPVTSKCFLGFGRWIQRCKYPEIL